MKPLNCYDPLILMAKKMEAEEKHINGIDESTSVMFCENPTIVTAKNTKAVHMIWLHGNKSILMAQNIQAGGVISLNSCPSLLIAQNIQSRDHLDLYRCPSLLELAPTVEGRRIYVSFNLKQ